MEDSDAFGLPVGVGMTSVLATYARAAESARTDSSFTDPWASEFLDVLRHRSSGRFPPPAFCNTYSLEAMIVRIIFFDEFLLRATRDKCE